MNCENARDFPIRDNARPVTAQVDRSDRLEESSLERVRLRGRRVAMVVLSRYPADPRLRRTVDALLQEGMTVDLICEGDDVSPKRETANGFEIIRVPIRHRRGGTLRYIYEYCFFVLVATFILALRSLKRHYDLVYVHNMPDILVFSALLPKCFGAKVILDQHDPMPELMKTIFRLEDKHLVVRLVRLLEKWSLAFANLVITVNVACMRAFSTRSCHPAKIAVVMNSPDDKIFPYRAARTYRYRPMGQRFVIMYHGSLIERNGLDIVVDALVHLKHTISNVELRIYGRSTPYHQQVMRKVHELCLDEQVFYFGPKTPEELVHEIEECDVGVISNHPGPFTDVCTPTRIFEYLALGKAVVAPWSEGIRDYFDRGSLLFYECGNARELANAVTDVYCNPISAVDIAERGQAVLLEHTWQQERRKLIRIVAQLFAPNVSSSLSGLSQVSERLIP